MNKKNLVTTVIAASFLTLGLSMPSCPGQQAMQQELDNFKKSQAEMQGRIGTLEAALKSMKDENEQTKGLIGQVSATLGEHTQAIEQLKAAKAAPAPKAKGKKR